MEITEYLPVDFRTQMEAETLCGAEEIRLRVGQPLEILYGDEKEKEIVLITQAHMREVLNYLRGILRWKAGTGSGFPGGQAMRNTEPQAV